jgi:large subunit ribosomal protein L15
MNLISAHFKTDSIIDEKALREEFKIAKTTPVKVLGRGKLDKSITLKGVAISSKAADKITQSGGKIEA